MPFRKYWLILLLFLVCPISWAVADVSTEHDKAREEQLGSSWLVEDLELLLRDFFGHDLLAEKLLDYIFIPPQLVSDPPGTAAAFLPYEGKRIGSVQLNKHELFSSRGEQLPQNITPSTKYEVIWDQLRFAVGDSLVAQHLVQSEKRLNQLPFVRKAKIDVQERTDDSDTVDIHVTIQHRTPITFALDPFETTVSISAVADDLLGWSHGLTGTLLYKQGLGYGVTYRASTMARPGLNAEFQYLYMPLKAMYRFRAFKKFADRASYAGKVVLGHLSQKKRRLLDAHTYPQPTSWSLYHGEGWLGRAFRSSKKDDHRQVVVTGGVAQKYFTRRPKVALNTNRYFHHYLLGTGSIGFTNKRHYEDQLVYGVGKTEHIPCGSKINLIGGYQFGEFVNRPYLRLDLAQGGRIPALGHWYGAVKAGGFWHAKTVEQGIVSAQLNYFTPLLSMGNQWIRQFVNMSYLGGFNMFTGELISTNAGKVLPTSRDPFLGGTQRFLLALETVLFTPIPLAGCQVAALGFVEAVRLQDAQGRVRQSSFCKTLGVGFRCAHPRWRLGALQVKISYQPLVQGIGFELGSVTTGCFEGLNIDEPGTIPFREY